MNNEDRVLLTIGNHEAMMIEAFLGNNRDAAMMWPANGGDWIGALSDAELIRYARWLNKQPLTLTVHYLGLKIGASHTTSPNLDWSKLHTYDQSSLLQTLLWDNQVVHQSMSRNIQKGVDLTFHGHSSVKKPTLLGNSLFADTFWASKHLSVFSIEDVHRLAIGLSDNN
jgi:hypothetical protein